MGVIPANMMELFPKHGITSRRLAEHGRRKHERTDYGSYRRHRDHLYAFVRLRDSDRRPCGCGLFTPVGSRGEEHCETSDHCVIRMKDGALTHVSIGKHSVAMIGFSDQGGDVRNYFDFLVTIQNASGNDLMFDPVNIENYDEGALIERTQQTEKEVEELSALTTLSMILGNTGNIAAVEWLRATTAEERSGKESRIRDQKLAKQMIPPGGMATGPVILRGDGEIADNIVISIPVGPDVHTVSFERRDLSSVLRRAKASGSMSVSDDFSFDGRWLSISQDGRRMSICFIRTEGSRISHECSGNASSGTFSGMVATLSGENIVPFRLTVIDQNTLEYEPLQFKGMIGKYVYERQY